MKRVMKFFVVLRAFLYTGMSIFSMDALDASCCAYKPLEREVISDLAQLKCLCYSLARWTTLAKPKVIHSVHLLKQAKVPQKFVTVINHCMMTMIVRTFV